MLFSCVFLTIYSYLNAKRDAEECLSGGEEQIWDSHWNIKKGEDHSSSRGPNCCFSLCKGHENDQREVSFSFTLFLPVFFLVHYQLLVIFQTFCFGFLQYFINVLPTLCRAFCRANLLSESQDILETIDLATHDIPDARTYLLTLKEIRSKYVMFYTTLHFVTRCYAYL